MKINWSIDLSHIIIIIFGVSGWIFHFVTLRIGEKYKSVEYLDKEISNIAILKNELKETFNKLAERVRSGDYESDEVKYLYQKTLKLYYPFFNALEQMCSKVQYGVIDIDYFEKQIGENLYIYAEAQILYIVILKKISEKLHIPFGLGRNEDTFRNFYQLIATRKTEEECLELNRKRRQVGLPAYNKLTQQIEWD